MPEVRCPTCARVFSYKKIGDFPHFPFCSERCRMVDLGKWFSEEHRISEKLDESNGLHIAKRLGVGSKMRGPAGNLEHKSRGKRH